MIDVEGLTKVYARGRGDGTKALDAGEGIRIKRGRSSLRGLLKGRIDSEGFEKDLKRLRKRWHLRRMTAERGP